MMLLPLLFDLKPALDIFDFTALKFDAPTIMLLGGNDDDNDGDDEDSLPILYDLILL